AGTHDAVVNMVLDGTVDAGTVRSDTLEQMLAEGLLSPGSIEILESKADEYPDFPFMLSTRLYPEWPLARLGHTDRELAELVAAALLAMSPDSAAARTAQCAGWTIPSDYTPVEAALKQLHVPPYDVYEKVTLPQLLQRHAREMAVGFVILAAIIAALLHIAGLNRKLLAAVSRSDAELAKREQAENELRAIQQNLERLIEARTSALVVANDGLRALITKNEELLRELHHRVSNNFQIIISMLNMHLNGVGGASGEDLCRSMQRRIASMSLVHELLVGSEFLESLRLRSLMELLASRVCEMMSYGSCRVTVHPDSVDCQIGLGMAMPLGLIISELISNALRYAHSGDTPGLIHLKAKQSDDAIVLTTADDGDGFPEGFDVSVSGHLGLIMVEALVKQIDGTWRFYNDGGAVCEVRFPLQFAGTLPH
ncbi:MAG: PhnD/SsuA/transferrin family substrate-binding protein, partial [Spirochaetales bacterium]|nr:PhnD/SsuA/transferrin family substrate-binding protein [Spirochaetales bacterium]